MSTVKLPTWKTKNFTAAAPIEAELLTEFSIDAPPSSDLWSFPDSTAKNNIPMVYKQIPLGKFKRMRVTLSTKTMAQYTQGGLVMMMGEAAGNEKWIKTGIEVMNGEQMVCVVGKDQGPDMSLGRRLSAGEWFTIEMARKDHDLVISDVSMESGSETGHVSILREIGWVFAGDLAVECLFGVYAAKPGTTDEEGVVEFRDLVFEGEDLD
ncbi:uncharacterized protein N7511_005450 [Penicillium nucicola]|uniref:uncharacterized protein n=1 Tax=Penicillium nucicola TaxID=1850975 RepID=UPI0025457ED8|nr:uncharacterized protein N7511_005450 [Penicillium nucicola]KAJ5762068.1 hypothetical protein N7511_005450 [Penicillium nucicola]